MDSPNRWAAFTISFLVSAPGGYFFHILAFLRRFHEDSHLYQNG
jgi:hypothetical protein